MSGIEFASTVIADTTLPSIPIVLISGHEHLAWRGAAAGIGHATRVARAQAKGAA